MKNEQVIPQQQQPQSTAIAVASTATTANMNNGTTASHSGSSGRSTPNNTDSAPGKLFVGGLSWQTSSDKLKEYFGMFGNVTDVLIMKDPVTQVKKRFISIFSVFSFRCCKYRKRRKKCNHKIHTIRFFFSTLTEEPWFRFHHILRA